MAVHTCECGGQLRRLVFGRPDSRDLEAGLLAEVVLGGCMVRGGGGDPNLACPSCYRRYVWFCGHLFDDEAWLAPVEATSFEPNALRVVLASCDGREVILLLTRDDHVFAHFSRMARAFSES